MKTLPTATLALILFCGKSPAQNYQLLSETKFASRIHVTNPSQPQQPRIAGADHLVSKKNQRTVCLELKDDSGVVVIDNKRYPLAADETKLIRQGLPVVVAKEFEIYLTSDAMDRSRAMLIVRSATDLDKAILYLIDLELEPK